MKMRVESSQRLARHRRVSSQRTAFRVFRVFRGVISGSCIGLQGFELPQRTQRITRAFSFPCLPCVPWFHRKNNMQNTKTTVYRADPGYTNGGLNRSNSLSVNSNSFF